MEEQTKDALENENISSEENTPVEQSSNNEPKSYANFDDAIQSAKIKIEKKTGRHKKKKVTSVIPFVRYDADLEIGLSSEQIEARISQGQTNVTKSGSTKTIGKIFLDNILTFFNLLMLVIAIWLTTIQSFKDMVFVIVVSCNIGIGIFQEIRTKRVIDKLSLLNAPNATILRDGIEYEIPTPEIVLDDIVILRSGNQIPSDSILIDGSIEVNESLLTGESDAISKNIGDLLFAGSFVVSGNCKARVERVGADNYVQKLTAQAKKYSKPKSDLLKTLNLFIKVIGIFIIPMSFLLFRKLSGEQYFNLAADDHEKYVTVVRSVCGAIIGMVPSGLFLTTSMALGVGVIRLAQNNTLVQELYCIEMLARVDVLCLDKTGTITDGSMKVKDTLEYMIPPGLNLKSIMSAIINATPDKNLTSYALEEKFGTGRKFKVKQYIPFSSERKYSAVTFEKFGTFVLGAPEFVLSNNYQSVSSDVEKAAKNGYRVILLAHSQDSIKDKKVPDNLEACALIYIEDTIRPDAVETISYFNESGVEIKVISGDNPITVSKVASRAGVLNYDKYISLDGLTDKEVIRAASKYTIFGRVSPSQKKLLIKTLKSEGHTCAMTGDGVNDILALREADCSIAIASGSEAVRNVSHLVLLDSNFSSMPKVVSEGRRVINNVEKIAALFLTKTILSITLAILALFIGEYPIKMVQLTLIEMLCIGIPSFILILEPNNKIHEGKFLFNVVKKALPGALTVLVMNLIVFLLRDKLSLTYNVRSTIIVLSATYTCFVVLFNTCKPFNNLHRWLFFFTFILFVTAIILVPNALDFVPLVKMPWFGESTQILNISEMMLLFCLCGFAPYIMSFFRNIISWIKSGVKSFLSFLARLGDSSEHKG